MTISRALGLMFVLIHSLLQVDSSVHGGHMFVSLSATVAQADDVCYAHVCDHLNTSGSDVFLMAAYPSGFPGIFLILTLSPDFPISIVILRILKKLMQKKQQQKRKEKSLMVGLCIQVF